MAVTALAHPPFPVDPAELAPHVLWKVEGRLDVLRSIPTLVHFVEKGGDVGAADCVDAANQQDLAVRSIFALTSMAYNERLRHSIISCRGFVELIVTRAMETDEASLEAAYIGLLYRLTFRLTEGSSVLPLWKLEQLLTWLTGRVVEMDSATAAQVDPAPFLGVLANLARSSLAVRGLIKGRNMASELNKSLVKLLAGPAVLCIVLALQALAAMELDEPLGQTLFNEENLRRIFELVFSLVREAEHNDYAHHALRAGADLLIHLFRCNRVLHLVESFGGVLVRDIHALLDSLVSASYGYDTALPLLELLAALLRPPAFRAQVYTIVHSTQAVAKQSSHVSSAPNECTTLVVLLRLAACPNADVAQAASNVIGILCRDVVTFSHTLPKTERDRAIDGLVVAAGLCNGERLSSDSCLNISGAEPSWMPEGNLAGGRRRRAACALLRDLAHTRSFGDAIAQRLRTASFTRAAQIVSCDGDYDSLLALLLLGLDMRQHLPSVELTHMLMLTRSEMVAMAWAEAFSTSCDLQAIQDSLVLAHRLFAVGDEMRSVEEGAAWSGRVELLVLIDALAKLNNARSFEFANLSSELRRERACRCEEMNKSEYRLREQQREERKVQEESETSAKIHAGQLQALQEELREERQRVSALESAAREDMESATREAMVLVAETRSELAATELRLNESEMKHFGSQEQQASTIRVRRELQTECAALHEARVELEVERLRCFRLDADAASSGRLSHGGLRRGEYPT